MALPTYETFLDRFAEFSSLGVTRESIEAEIASATRQVNETWGEQREDGVGFLAAHMLVMKNRAKCCKLINDEGTTSYLAQYERMQEAIVSGDRVY